MLPMSSAREVIEAVERLAPPSLAENWDNCGLQCGDPGAEVGKVLVALTPLPEVFDEAERTGANFLLFHHPLIFSPLKSLNTRSYPGELLSRAVKNNLTVYAAHTSYDAAPEGVSVALAGALGLDGPLKTVSPRGSLRKLVVFVPEESAEKVDLNAKLLKSANTKWVQILRAQRNALKEQLVSLDEQLKALETE